MLRLLPPLCLKTAEIDLFVAKLKEAVVTYRRYEGTTALRERKFSAITETATRRPDGLRRAENRCYY